MKIKLAQKLSAFPQIIQQIGISPLSNPQIRVFQVRVYRFLHKVHYWYGIKFEELDECKLLGMTLQEFQIVTKSKYPLMFDLSKDFWCDLNIDQEVPFRLETQTHREELRNAINRYLKNPKYNRLLQDTFFGSYSIKGEFKVFISAALLLNILFINNHIRLRFTKNPSFIDEHGAEWPNSIRIEEANQFDDNTRYFVMDGDFKFIS